MLGPGPGTATAVNRVCLSSGCGSSGSGSSNRGYSDCHVWASLASLVAI